MTEFLHLVLLWQYVVHFTLLLKHTHLPFTQPDLQLQCETSVFLRLNFFAADRSAIVGSSSHPVVCTVA